MAIENHDFSQDQLNPKMLHEQVRAHDKRSREQRGDWALTKATYLTKYWDHRRQGADVGRMVRNEDVEIEVNRLWGVITAYLSALYPRASRAILSPDPAGEGDAEKAELALNRWLGSTRSHSRVMSALRQALLYPGSGAKVGYRPGRGSPLDRVWLRVIPWWEMLLDSDVSDQEDERFRGHIYYRAKSEVEREYGLEDLSGSAREDFLSNSSKYEDTSKKKRRDQKVAESDRDNFVRVLEVCNLVDTIRDKNNPDIEYMGRLEIYVLGQGRESLKPVWMGPLPFASVDGTPLPHIVPLVFNHEPEYPLRGVAHASRILPQIKELNSYRSFMAMASRKDTRQYLTRKGTFSADELTKLTEGEDGLILQVDQDFTHSLDDAIRPINNSPLSSNFTNYMNTVEADLERNIGFSPQARGIVTKATAFEVQAVQQYTESEYGMHAAIKDEWLIAVLRIVLRAIVASMQDTGDSAGAYDGQELDMANVGAVQSDGEEDATESVAEEAAIADIAGGNSPLIDDDMVPELGRQDIHGGTAVKTQEMTLRDRREIIAVNVMDLNADFEISFVEGGRTPSSDTAMQQNLIGLMDPYMSLWQASQEEGPQGVMARAYMKVIAERFDLPKDLHPDELELRIETVEEEEPEETSDDQEMRDAMVGGQPQGAPPAAPPPGAPPGAPPPGAPPGAPPPAAGNMQQMFQQLAQLPPEQAISQLRQVFSDNPQMVELLDRAATLPPEEQARIIGMLAEGAGASI